MPGPKFDFKTVTPEEAGFSASVLAELDSYYDALIAKGEFAGHVMLLAKGENLVRGHTIGYADWETKAPLHPDTIFSLYSMSKPFAAVAMLLLHEEGRWQVDDPVADYLPEFADIAKLPKSSATRGPTIRETFTHTAGFSFGKSPEEMKANLQQLDWQNARSLNELVGRYAAMPLHYQPGTAWEYSAATDLQAEIVERLTGERYDLFLKRRLFQPLGMIDTRFELDALQTRRLARRHVLDAETGRLRGATRDEQMEAIFPMGVSSFKSTALDYARFARMLLNRGSLGEVQILKPESVDLMLSNLLSEDFLTSSYHVGHYTIGGGNGHGMNGLVCVDPARAGRPVGKGTYEWGGGFSTWFWIDPEHDILCIGMTSRKRLPSDMRPPEAVAQELVYRALRERR